MTTQPYRFEPPVPVGGGTRYGYHYLREAELCPRKHLYRFAFPVDGKPEGPYVGLTPVHTDKNLLLGRLVHAALEAWYASGCRNGEDTGERDLNRALAHLAAVDLSQQAEYVNATVAESCLVTAREIMIAYDEYYGPGGIMPEYPELRVLHDTAGEPLIERQFTLELPANRTYTVRPDLLIDHLGMLRVVEHKTSSASAHWVKRRHETAHMDPQLTGEMLALHTTYPDAPLNDIWLQIIYKGRHNYPAPSERHSIKRHPEDLVAFQLWVVEVLQTIDDRMGRYVEMLHQGVPWNYAADHTHPERGRLNDYCYAFGRDCEFLQMCRMKGMEHQFLGGYRVRATGEAAADQASLDTPDINQ